MTNTADSPIPGGGSQEAGPVATIIEATEMLDQAAETFWAARPGWELPAAVDAVTRLRAKLDALELSVVQELDASPGGRAALKEAGWASVKDFVTHAVGGRKGAGPSTVRLARHLEDFPSLAEGLAAGTLSRVKAQIIAAAVDKLPLGREVRDQALRVMLEQAHTLSSDDLERAGRHILEVVDPESVDARLERALERTERAAHQNRSINFRFDRLGGGRGQFHGSAEDVLLLKTALLSLAAPEPSEPGACGGDDACTSGECKARGHSGRDLRGHGARMFDALIELTRRGQAAGALPGAHGGIPQVVVTMDYEGLKDRVGEATTTLGEDLGPATVRRMACDADIIPGVLGAASSILDVGRAQRLVTSAIWAALVVRDRHCAFPGCRRPPVMCHAHHIVHWIDGGVTSLDNLVMLCGSHHRIMHDTPWRVRLKSVDRRPDFRPPRHDTWVRDPAAEPPPEARPRRPAA